LQYVQPNKLFYFLRSSTQLDTIERGPFGIFFEGNKASNQLEGFENSVNPCAFVHSLFARPFSRLFVHWTSPPLLFLTGSPLRPISITGDIVVKGGQSNVSEKLYLVNSLAPSGTVGPTRFGLRFGSGTEQSFLCNYIQMASSEKPAFITFWVAAPAFVAF
jgi:hypothetical protein